MAWYTIVTYVHNEESTQRQWRKCSKGDRGASRTFHPEAFPGPLDLGYRYDRVRSDFEKTSNLPYREDTPYSYRGEHEAERTASEAMRRGLRIRFRA